MSDYPDAPRYIPATPVLLEGWCGPMEWRDVENEDGPVELWRKEWWNGWRSPARLDPLRPEVRDHLVRRLSLPGWMRDGAGVESWQSAGLIACAAAGVVPSGLAAITPDGDCRWRVSLGGGVPAHMDADEEEWRRRVVADGCALMQDADTMILPWPGGPRVWRRT